MLNYTELNQRVLNDSEFNASESNDSKSFCQGIFNVHIIANQFGFNDRIIEYLDTVLDHEAVPYYDKVKCRISHVSNSKLEDIDKPELFNNYKCALYAICKVLLKDHLEGLSEDHDKKVVKKRLDTFNKHVLAELFGYEKLLFDAYEFKAHELIESEKKRKRELSYVLFVNDQFGLKDSVHRYLAEVFNNSYTAFYYSEADYRGTSAGEFKLENLKKPELFDESICAFYAVSSVLLYDHTQVLLEDYSNDLLAGCFEEYLKDHVDVKLAEHALTFIDNCLVSRLTKSEQQKSKFYKYRKKAVEFLEAEKKRKRESSVKR